MIRTVYYSENDEVNLILTYISSKLHVWLFSFTQL